MYYIASIAALMIASFILPVSAQETPSLPELCESIKRIQDRVFGQVIEVEGKHSNNVIGQQRPTPFAGKFDERRFWCRRELPSFESMLGEETIAFKGMSGIEIGVVTNVLVEVNSIEHEPRFSIAFADRDKTYADVNLFAGLFLAFGKLPEFKQVLNQDEQSSLIAMLSHPNARLEAIAGAEQQYQVEYRGR